MNKIKIQCETFEYLNGKLINHKKEYKETECEWKNDYKCNDNISIGKINPMYIEINEIQDVNDEYKKIKKFLNKFLDYYASKNDISIDSLQLEFINYGKTELVYVLKENNMNTLTILVKQPAVRFGKVKQEALYLNELKKTDENVIAPIDYFSLWDQELYITPYINQARCIASYNGWGMYIPEPYYRFEKFNEEQQTIINTCMIAKLVSYYDLENKQGISACKLGGGDFMLPKDWEKTPSTIEETLKELYFIAAREKISCTLDEYLTLIRNEFSKVTINEIPKTSKINIRGRVPMNTQEIEAGIELGKTLLQKDKFILQRTKNNKL